MKTGGRTLALVSLIAAGAISACTSSATSSSSRWPPGLLACGTARNQFACLAPEYRPIGGKPVVVDHGPRHWTLLAWAYALRHHGDGWCWATFHGPRFDGSQCGDGIPFFPGRGFSEMTNSYADPGTVIPLRGGANLWAVPSLVTAAAARVVIVYRGHKYPAPVARVPVGGGRWVGAFQVWLRLPRRSSGWNGNQISSEVAYDPAGHVVARHGPWAV